MPTPRKRRTKKAPASGSGEILDRHLGRRLARRRKEKGRTAKDLDAVLGLPKGAVAAFESGARSMNARNLYAASRALGVPVIYFFEGMPAISLPGLADAPPQERIGETARFIDAYYKIEDAKVRRDILSLLKAAGRRR